MKEQKLAHIARHGQTEWNREKRLQGRKNSPLTLDGLQHAENIGKQLKDKGIIIILSSPLERAKQTADAISHHTSTPIRIIPEFIEMDFGLFEGNTLEEMNKKHPDFFLERNQSSQHKLQTPYPEGESYIDVHNRIKEPVQQVMNDFPEGKFVIVGHESVNRMIRGILLDLPLEKAATLRQKNNELVVVNFVGKEETILSL